MADVLSGPVPVVDGGPDAEAPGVGVVDALPAGTATGRDRSVGTTARRPRGLLIGLFTLGVVVGVVFSISLPPWAIEDEPQHVDYVHQIATTGWVPSIDAELAPTIVGSMFDDDRWTAYGQQTPTGPSSEELGLAGRSYLGYHPPLPYGLMALVDAQLPAGGDVELYGLRALMAVTLGIACTLTALLAARLVGGTDTVRIRWTGPARRAALGAGLAMAVLPVVADAAGRVNTDLVAMVAVLTVVFALLRWHITPRPDHAVVVGLALAAAAATRETTIVVLVAVAAALVHAARRGDLRLGDVVRMLLPPVAVVVVWALFVRLRTGTTLGPSAFVDQYGVPFTGMPFVEVVRELPARALLPWGDWNLPMVASLAVLTALTVGVVWAYRGRLRWAAAVTALMALAQVTIVVVGAMAGFSTVTGRLLLPVIPLLVAVSAAGWATRGRRAGTLAWIGLSVGFGVWFLVGDQVARYGFGF